MAIEGGEQTKSMDMTMQHLALGGAWALYFAIHSLLASLSFKSRIARRWPRFMPLYRMGYNGIAVVLLIPLAGWTYRLEGPWIWRWEGTSAYVANGLALLAVGGFIWSLRYYDSQEFLGLRQWRRGERSPVDQERFRISPLHRFVRHPWYALGLLILWTRDLNLAWSMVFGLTTVYLFVGSRMEEHKLLRYHGSIYQEYRTRVPGLIPLPWRYLSRREADELVRRYQQTQAPSSGPAGSST